jgi:hypothetical protein
LDPENYAALLLTRIESAYEGQGHRFILGKITEEVERLIRSYLGVGPSGDLAEHMRDGNLRVLAILGGNEHNVVGLINYGDDYDFLLPGETGSIRPGTTLVPFNAIRFQMEHQTAAFRDMLDCITRLTGGRTIYLEPPPPIRDSEFILRHLDPYYRQRYGDKIAISAPEFRFKLWRLRCMVFHAQCSRQGIPYVSVPPELMEDGRYLNPNAIAGDATHANALFGRSMLEAALNIDMQ